MSGAHLEDARPAPDAGHPSEAMTAAAQAETLPPDRLDAVRVAVERVRELRLEAAALTQRLAEVNAEVGRLTRRELVDMFLAAPVTRLDVPASGNKPAFEARLRPFYKAVISAEWEEPRRAAALAVLEEHHASDLVKTTFTVAMGRGEREEAKRLRDLLAKLRVPFQEKLDVPWNSLTAWLRERYERSGKTLTPGELEKIGAVVGQVVEVEQAGGKR